MANNLVMRNPILSEVLADTYFEVTKKEGRIPTVPGLIMAMGFNRVSEAVAVLKSYEEGGNTYPESCIFGLMRAITKIEDHYLQNGLTEKFPASLVKFCLGTYHDRVEKADPTPQGNQVIQVVFEDPTQRSMRISNQMPTIESLRGSNTPIIELQSAN